MLVRKRSSVNNLVFILAGCRNVPSRLNTPLSPLRAQRCAGDFSLPSLQRSSAFVRGEIAVLKVSCAGVTYVIFTVIKLRKCSLHGELVVFPVSFSSVLTCLLSRLPNFHWLLCSKHHQPVNVLLTAKQIYPPQSPTRRSSNITF